MSEFDFARMGRVHHAFIEPLRRTGRAPSRAQVSAALSLTPDELGQALADLEATHGIVLHPHSGEPWVIHPFSTSPTATWVEQQSSGWWAPCLWCAFGVAGLIGGEATIHTRLGGEREAVAVHVHQGSVSEQDICVHFAVPPREAWNNVHHFCATVLPFRSESEVTAWCDRHGLAKGGIMPVAQACELGRQWYTRHCDVDWRKWTGAEAATVFEQVGLTDSFWALERSNESF
jgi:Alkylmercury lyase